MFWLKALLHWHKLRSSSTIIKNNPAPEFESCESFDASATKLLAESDSDVFFPVTSVIIVFEPSLLITINIFGAVVVDDWLAPLSASLKFSHTVPSPFNCGSPLTIFWFKRQTQMTWVDPTTINCATVWHTILVVLPEWCIIFQMACYQTTAISSVNKTAPKGGWRSSPPVCTACCGLLATLQACSLRQRRDKTQWILVMSSFQKLQNHVTVNCGRNSEIWLQKAVD